MEVPQTNFDAGRQAERADVVQYLRRQSVAYAMKYRGSGDTYSRVYQRAAQRIEDGDHDTHKRLPGTFPAEGCTCHNEIASWLRALAETYRQRALSGGPWEQQFLLERAEFARIAAINIQNRDLTGSLLV